MIEERRSFFLYILMVAAMAIWGGAWAVGKVVSSAAAPQVIVFWRFLLTTLSFLPLMPIFKAPFKLSFKGVRYILVGAVLLVAYNHLFFSGLRLGLASVGGMLFPGLSSVATFCLSMLLYRILPSRVQAAGLFLGVAGALVLLKIWELDAGQLLASGNLFFVIGSLTWALVTISSNRAQHEVPFLTYSFWIYALSTLLDFILALPHGVLTVRYQGLSFWLAMAYLAILANSFSMTAYFFASRKLGSNRASAFMLLVPLGALLSSCIFLRESPDAATLAGGGLTLAAILLINRRSAG